MDASESNFSCVDYSRVNDRGQSRSFLVAAKAKVAQLTEAAVDCRCRLELQAVVNGSRPAKSIADHHILPMNHRFLWSEFKTVQPRIYSDAHLSSSSTRMRPPNGKKASRCRLMFAGSLDRIPTTRRRMSGRNGECHQPPQQNFALSKFIACS